MHCACPDVSSCRSHDVAAYVVQNSSTLEIHVFKGDHCGTPANGLMQPRTPPTSPRARPKQSPPLLGPESLNGKYVLEIRPLPIPRGVLGPFLTKYPKACGVFAIAKFCATMPRMALSPKKKATIIKSSARHDKDTGSPEVQVNLISKRIDDLSKHLKKNRKDKHSRRGLLGLVAERRTHLEYLKKKNPVKHAELLKKIKE